MIIGLRWTRGAFNIAVYAATLRAKGRIAATLLERATRRYRQRVWLVAADWCLELGHLIATILLAITDYHAGQRHTTPLPHSTLS